MFEYLRVGFMIWIGLGLPVTVYTLSLGMRRLSSGAHHGTIGLRVLLVPSAVLLWPVLLRAQMKGHTP